MDLSFIVNTLADFSVQCTKNYISKKHALKDDLVNLRLFEPPIAGCCDMKDSYLLSLKDAPHAKLQMLEPLQWMPEGNSVVSLFFPFTERVKKSNAKDMSYPSLEWLHARIEGQEFISAALEHIVLVLNQMGYETMVPQLDSRFYSIAQLPEESGDSDGIFTSNWSERHIAYAAGLGTFSLSRAIITEKGVAGRFGSFITTLALPATQRKYHSLYEYCTMCGKCIINCPVNAISFDRKKEHAPCARFGQKVAKENSPYYGCGKCQIAVPCESRIPI